MSRTSRPPYERPERNPAGVSYHGLQVRDRDLLVLPVRVRHGCPRLFRGNVGNELAQPLDERVPERRGAYWG